jgi:hypothetical protein
MGIDAAGVVMGWKLFDHAAHLGGALFGMWVISVCQQECLCVYLLSGYIRVPSKTRTMIPS